MFLSLFCVFVDASLCRRHGEAVLHHCDKRPGRGGVGMPGLRSGTPELPAGRLLLRSLPRWFLHRQRHQPMPGVPAQHTPGGAPHLRPGRVCRLWAWKHKQQGGVLLLIPKLYFLLYLTLRNISVFLQNTFFFHNTN